MLTVTSQFCFAISAETVSGEGFETFICKHCFRILYLRKALRDFSLRRGFGDFMGFVSAELALGLLSERPASSPLSTKRFRDSYLWTASGPLSAEPLRDFYLNSRLRDFIYEEGFGTFIRKDSLGTVICRSWLRDFYLKSRFET